MAAFFPLWQLGISEKDVSGVFHLYFVSGRIAELRATVSMRSTVSKKKTENNNIVL